MLQVKCINKIRDKQGVIQYYTLLDYQGNQRTVTSQILKNAIRNKQIDCINLTLTSDNRLINNNNIDKNKKELNNYVNKIKKDKHDEKQDLTCVEMYKRYMSKIRVMGVQPDADYKIEGSDVILRSALIINGTFVIQPFVTKIADYGVFSDKCERLKVINKSNIVSMRKLFAWCDSLIELDLSQFDTSKVEDMEAMFEGCKHLKKLDLSNFNTSNVKTMAFMFDACRSLEELNINNFDTSNVKDMFRMFYECDNLKNLDISNFKSEQIRYRDDMFRYCKFKDTFKFPKSKIVNVDGKLVSQLELYENYKKNTDKLEQDKAEYEVLGENIILTKVYVKYGDFTIEPFVTEIGSQYFIDIQGDKQIDNFVFGGCRELTLINKSDITDMSYLFYESRGLTWLDLRGFDTSKVTNMSHMFEHCYGLGYVDLSNFNTLQVTDMSNMFAWCGLRNFDLHSFDTSNVVDMSAMFMGCSNLEQIDLRNFRTSKVTDISLMFDECTKLEKVDLRNFSTSRVTDMSFMFDNCRNLVKLDLKNFRTSNVTDFEAMFMKCENLRVLDLSNFTTQKAINMSAMFMGCKSLATLELNKFNISKVKYKHDMFTGCKFKNIK